MSRADLRKRVAALNDAINPAGSLTAKLAKLTDEQRDEYHRWRERCAAYYMSNPGGTAYARLLSGEQPPPLRRDVRHALFGPEIRLSANGTIAEAQALYNSVAFGNGQ